MLKFKKYLFVMFSILIMVSSNVMVHASSLEQNFETNPVLEINNSDINNFNDIDTELKVSDDFTIVVDEELEFNHLTETIPQDNIEFYTYDISEDEAILGYFEIAIPSENSATVTTYRYDEQAVVTVALVRSGNSTTVESIMYIYSDFSVNAVRFKQFNVTSTSSLNPETYGSLGIGTAYTTLNFTAGTTVSRSILTCNIPTSVSKAKVTVSDLQIYALSYGWLSGYVNSTNVTIK